MEKSTLIKNIEDIRESRVITYITSDRQGPVGETQWFPGG
ncbi:MAG: hypothetical protein XE08_0545 [Parcubacteria bacterium 32_520]|nr:MAG: hypothetical protein XE08_0545 [Parcubacteria bacterium 32_520]